MKKRLGVILAILILATSAGIQALASDTTGALWSGIVRITNNSTAASTVSVNFTANTTVFIANGYINSSGNNTSLQIAGADVAYMPGYAGAPWAVYAGSIGANAIVDGTLYMGGASMNSMLRWFPAAGGGTVPDNASLEFGNNGSTPFKGYVDTLTAGNITEKLGAYNLYSDGTGNVTATIWQSTSITANATPNAAGDYTNLTPSPGPTNYLDVDEAPGAPDEYGTTVYTTSAAQVKDAYNLTSPIIPNQPFLVGVFFRHFGLGAIAHAQPYLRLGGVETAGTEVVSLDGVWTSTTEVLARPGGGSWAAADIPSLQVVIGIRGDGVNEGDVTQVYAVIYSAPTVSVAVTSQDMLVTPKSDGTNFWLVAGSAVSANTTAATMINNSNNWTIGSTATPYIEYTEIDVAGVQKGYWSWEYATTFTDQSGNGNTLTPTFLSSSSDADVSAELISFAPITEADAPPYTVDDPTDFVTTNVTVSGGFTSNTTGSTAPGIAVIEVVSTAGDTPTPFVLYLIVGIVLISLSFGISYLMRNGGSSSLVIKLLLILGALGVLIAIGIVDDWVLYLFAMVGIGIAFIASNRHFEGTGNTGNNLLGFLIMSWLGLMVVNNILEGNILTQIDRTSMNDFLIFRPWSIGAFVLPVPSVRFLTVGLPALMEWDYTVFGGNAQIFTYLMYSITGVVAFMFFTVAMGIAGSMFSRSR